MDEQMSVRKKWIMFNSVNQQFQKMGKGEGTNQPGKTLQESVHTSQ